MFDVQHVIGLKQHVKLNEPLPLTHDDEDEDEDSPNLLGYIQIISFMISNNACSSLYPL